MSNEAVHLSPEEELLVLLFWAYSKDVEKKLGPEKLRALPRLGMAIEALGPVPAAIGWDDDAAAVQSLGQSNEPLRRRS